MDLATIEMPRVEARKAYLKYRGAISEAQGKELDEVKARQLDQDRAIARAYRQLSIGRQVISLPETIIAGGFDAQSRPRLAVVRADAEECIMTRQRSGELTFYRSEDGWRRWHSVWMEGKRIRVQGPEIPDNDPWRIEAAALSPNIPPQFRPGAGLHNYHLLWEAEWRNIRQARRAPKDPALLKHLGGAMFAVLAVWDLTEVERWALEGGTV